MGVGINVRRSVTLACTAAAALLVSPPAAAQCPVKQAKLVPGTGVFTHLGWATAAHGDVVVAGSWIRDTVHVFRRRPAGWEEAQILWGPQAFGIAVAFDGRTIAVGSVGAVGGAVHLFRSGDAGRWREVEQIAAPNPITQGQFGRSLAISGGTLAVGDPGAGSEVHVYSEGAGGWNRDHVLKFPGPHQGQFGWSLALDGDRLLVGKYDAGAALFQRTAAGWQLEQAFYTPSPNAAIGFGHAVALEGDTALVGAPFENEKTGAVYAFERGAAGWAQTVRILDPNGAKDAEFGRAIGLEGDVLVVGSPLFGVLGMGKAAQFRRGVAGTWTWLADFQPANNSYGDNFGMTVAVQGGAAFVGCPGDDPALGGTNAGAIYVYDLCP